MTGLFYIQLANKKENIYLSPYFHDCGKDEYKFVIENFSIFLLTNWLLWHLS